MHSTPVRKLPGLAQVPSVPTWQVRVGIVLYVKGAAVEANVVKLTGGPTHGPAPQMSTLR